MSAAPFDILYVITDLELGGVPLHLHRLCRAMTKRGFCVAVCSLASPGPVGKMLEEDGIAVHTCSAAGGWDFRVFGRLTRLLRELRPDIVHSFLFHANFAARRAARRAGIPPDRVLCEIQTVEIERRWHLRVDRFSHSACRYFIGNSPSVIDHLAAQARIPRDRLRLVRGGVDPDRFAGVVPLDRAALKIPADAPILLWVGRLDPVKGLFDLLDAFALIAPSHPAQLLLVGDGSLRARLEQHARSLRLADRVHFLGSRTDIPELLATADVFVFPSRTEGLPNALLEAMATGCAVVTTDVPGCRDLVTDQDTGFVVPRGDVAGLAETIARLLRDAALAKRLGQAAQAHVREHWTIETTWNAYEALYREVISSSDVGHSD
ncbi:MAG: glycosyltransferase [Phycisphaerae bacterium]|nr:glycosyltransferase [Phycisphaerae bacterium]